MTTREELIELARAHWYGRYQKPSDGRDLFEMAADFVLPLLAAERERALDEAARPLRRATGRRRWRGNGAALVARITSSPRSRTLLRDRLGLVVEIAEQVKLAKYDMLGQSATIPISLTVKAQNALARLRAGAKGTR